MKMKKTKQPRKQRKRRYTAPLHIKQHYLHAHLSKELREKVKKRSVRIRKGDRVRIIRGKYAKKEGKILEVDLKKGGIYVEGVTKRKARGQESPMFINPSNVIIIEMAERK